MEEKLCVNIRIFEKNFSDAVVFLGNRTRTLLVGLLMSLKPGQSEISTYEASCSRIGEFGIEFPVPDS